jgi:hypothetical protein
MARSSMIYIVQDIGEGWAVITAFTVKYELLNWLRDRLDREFLIIWVYSSGLKRMTDKTSGEQYLKENS